jgi:transposase
MFTLMKCAQPVFEAVRITLQEMYKHHPTFRCRQRAQAILLSARGYSLEELVLILEVRRDAISDWINRWNREGLLGLYDRSRTGRPPIYTQEEVNLLKTLVDEAPRSLKTAQTQLASMTQKVASTSTLKRLLKKNSTIAGSGCASH